MAEHGGGGEGAAPRDGHPLASTAHLFARAQCGDGAARSEILLRYREPLARFLHGRLAPSARGELETADIVQEVLTAALGQLERIEYRDLGFLESTRSPGNLPCPRSALPIPAWP